MALLTVQQTNAYNGINTSYAAASSGGDTFANDGRTMLHVKNGGASGTTVTIASQRACSQGGTHNLSVLVAVAGEAMIGPFAPSRFSDTNGIAAVTYSASASVTIAAVRML